MQSTVNIRIGIGLALALLLTGRSAVHATERTWNGGGSDDNWTTGANWGGTAPIADDSLIFDGSIRLSPNNDLAADTAFGGITFNPGAGSFTLGGNRITLGGPVSNAAANAQSIALDMILDAIRTLDVTTDGSQTVSGDLTGVGGLTKTGGGTLLLSGANSFTNVTRISDGIFRVGRDLAFAESSGKLIIEDGATFDLTHSHRAAVTTFAIAFGGIGYDGMGALRNTGNTVIYERPPFTMTADALVHAAGGYNAQIMLWRGEFNMNGYTLTKEGNQILSIRQNTINNLGDIVVAAGRLRFQNSNTFHSEQTRTMTVKSGAVVDFLGTSSTYPMNVSMENGSTLDARDGGTPILTGTITLEGSSTIGYFNGQAGRSLTLSGKITGSGGFSTPVSFTADPGLLIVSGNENDYSGNTTVRDKSVLRVSNTTGSATGAGTVTVESGGGLEGTGIIGGDVVINGGGSLSPADVDGQIGTLTFNSNLTLDENAVLKVDFDATQSDLVAVDGAVALPATLDLDLNNLDESTPISIPLITAAGGFTGIQPTQWDAIEIEGIEYRFRIEGDTLLVGQPSGILFIIR